MAKKTVDNYIAGLDGWRAETVTRLREIVRTAVPDADEAVKWAQPVYSTNGPFCYMKAFKNSVNFGFWRGVELDDPHGLLQGTGDKMRHVKLTSTADIQPDAFADLVRQAQQLNHDKGDPTRG